MKPVSFQDLDIDTPIPYSAEISSNSDQEASISQDTYTFDESSKQSRCEFQKIGNCYTFLHTKEGKPMITIGPDFKFSIIMLLGALAYLVLATYGIRKISDHYWYVRIGMYAVLCVFFGSMLATVLVNPGIPRMTRSKDLGNPMYCRKCKIVADGYRVIHCNVCEVCVEGYDHHCPWMGKCIASRNIYLFNLFIVSYVISWMCNILTWLIVVVPHLIKGH
ncbi:unnamed protein product [Moneuplotes crassus]|uniref:Palmitoyltransferase n=1 Tax=Euplotes crassus TaxID=5936 RepID=A0AAD1XC09_EUPCR|nr:unnamed protein product [Moneuplotes crassus]